MWTVQSGTTLSVAPLVECNRFQLIYHVSGVLLHRLLSQYFPEASRYMMLRVSLRVATHVSGPEIFAMPGDGGFTIKRFVVRKSHNQVWNKHPSCCETQKYIANVLMA